MIEDVLTYEIIISKHCLVEKYFKLRTNISEMDFLKSTFGNVTRYMYDFCNDEYRILIEESNHSPR